MEPRLSDLTKELREKHAGRLFGRWARAMALSRRKGEAPATIAERMRWVEANAIASITKAAVAGDTTATSSLHYPLAQDLAPLEANVSAVRQMQAAMRQTPSNRNVITQTAGAIAYWIGEGGAAPLSELTVGPSSALQPMRLSSLSVITNELAETSNAENIIAVDHARAKADKLDSTFFDIYNAGSPENLPASVTHSARQFESSGSTVSLVDTDLRVLVATLSAGGSNLRSGVWIMRPETGANLGSLRGSGGSPAYPGLGINGGVLLGLPVLTTQGIGLAGSPAESFIVLCDPSRIWFVDDGASFNASKRVTVEMTDAPTNDSAAGTAAAQVSMFQTESTAILTTSYINWKTVDDTSACVVLTRCNF